MKNVVIYTLNYCPFCKKAFSTKGNLKYHIKSIHQGIRLFSCTFPGCNKRYSNRSALAVHFRNHLGQTSVIFASSALTKKEI